MHPGPSLLNEETPLLLSDGGSNGLKDKTFYIYLVACMSAISGFLFGYDTGIISGALIYIKGVFNLNEWWQESIVSSTLLTAWLFSIMSGAATDKFGRKPIIILSSFIFVIGSILMAFATDKIFLLVGRSVVGAAVGLSSMTVPVYIAEVAPSSIRGQLVMVNMCCITGGQFFASIIAYGFSFIKSGDGWRYMLGFAAVPAAIQFFGFLIMPESPRWLVSEKKYDEAKRVLKRIRSKDSNTEAEFEAIRNNCLRAREEQKSQNQSEDQLTFMRILKSPSVRRACLVGCLLQLTQQVNGINTVMYYSASIFEMSGVHEKQTAILLTIATSFVNFVMTFVGFVLVERTGRRKLTLISLFGVIVSLCILAAGFQFAYDNSPISTQLDHSVINQPCDTYGLCRACSKDPECGFCFNTNSITSYASCLKINTTHEDQSLIGNCMTGSNSTYTWAYEWCPSSYSWLTLLGMVLYLFFFAPGMGPMPWTINSEIYPSWARSWCSSASTSVNWLSNLIVAMTFLSLARAITNHGAFYLYALLSSFCFIFFLVALPETRGRTLEDVETLFADKKSQQQTQRREALDNKSAAC